MFIELTDHLRCPADHPEAFLVLIPDHTEGRSVLEGLLGCPICHREYRIANGVVHFGDPAQSTGSTLEPSLADALATFVGLEGAGGYLGVIGEAGGLAAALSERVPGVHLAVVNPPEGLPPMPAVSVLRSPRVPFKQRSLRGVVLSRPYAGDPAWQAEAVGAVLPGLRIVGADVAPMIDGLEVLAATANWWVGRKTS